MIYKLFSSVLGPTRTGITVLVRTFGPRNVGNTKQAHAREKRKHVRMHLHIHSLANTHTHHRHS